MVGKLSIAVLTGVLASCISIHTAAIAQENESASPDTATQILIDSTNADLLVGELQAEGIDDESAIEIDAATDETLTSETFTEESSLEEEASEPAVIADITDLNTSEIPAGEIEDITQISLDSDTPDLFELAATESEETTSETELAVQEESSSDLIFEELEAETEVISEEEQETEVVATEEEVGESAEAVALEETETEEGVALDIEEDAETALVVADELADGDEVELASEPDTETEIVAETETEVAESEAVAVVEADEEELLAAGEASDAESETVAVIEAIESAEVDEDEEDIKAATEEIETDRGTVSEPEEAEGDGLPVVLKLGRLQNDIEELELAPATLYSYDIQGQEAATVYLEGLPVLTFVDTATEESETPLEQASNLTASLNLLSQQDLEGVEIDLQEEAGVYTITVDGDPLVDIDNSVRRENGSSANTALEATNRMRRLLTGEAPIARAPGQPSVASTVASSFTGTVRSIQQGLASWYGPGFAGRRTANGEIFNPGQLTAAHLHLPFGTRVEVVNVRTGQSVVVRINDRGPYIHNRVIDLSAGAARAIGLMGAGVGPVELRILQ